MPTTRGSWRRDWRRVGKAEVDVEVDADMVEEKLEEDGGGEGGGGGGRTALTKSNNPHLAGGENCIFLARVFSLKIHYLVCRESLP